MDTMKEILEIASNVSTPLALGGLIAAIFFLILRQIIAKNIFPTLTKAVSGDILKLIINRLFMLALVAMVLGFAGYIISRIAFSLSQNASFSTTQSANELINILNLRAENILDIMETEKKKALASIHSGRGYSSEAEYLQDYEATRELFIELHNKNIESIKNGQLNVSHELISDIHHLLWVRKRNTFWGAYAVRGLPYSVKFDAPETYYNLYPGQSSKDLAEKYPKEVSVIWTGQEKYAHFDFDRRRQLEEQLKKAR